MKKLRAFTLMELLIGMIIGSIVVGCCYFGYSIIWKQFGDYRNMKHEINAAMQLNEVLLNDFSRSQEITFSDNKLKMELDSSAITYEFNDSVIVRITPEAADTFHFATTELQSEFIGPGFSGGTVKSFSFSTGVLGEREIFNFDKTYSAAFFMNHQDKTEDGN